MDRLYAPWRHEYVTRVTSSRKSVSKKNCVFCKQISAKQDDDFFIVKRFKYCVVMMNYYPYNSGHIMVLPYEHKANMHNLNAIARAEIMEVVCISTPVLEKTLNAQGFNIGINLGSAGGGGLPSHLHVHILPRWKGDTNFLETLGRTKLITTDIVKTFSSLKKAFKGIIL